MTRSWTPVGEPPFDAEIGEPYIAPPEPHSGSGLLKDHYAAAVEEAKDEYGFEKSGFEIHPRTRLERCIGYTVRYVVEDPARYFRYQRPLERMWDTSDLRQPRVVHLDIGCGPGLFSWVVHDTLCRAHGLDVAFFGLDYAPAMCKLAKTLWLKLSTKADLPPLTVDHNRARLMEALAKVTPPFDLIITFGYVLVGEVRQRNWRHHDAIPSFAKMVAECAQRAAGETAIVVSDASAHAYADYFDTASDDLVKALRVHGLRFDPVPLGEKSSQMYGTLTPR